MRVLAKYASTRGGNPRFYRLLKLCHGGAFSRRAKKKVLIVHETRRIAYTEVYPFLYYARAFAEAHGAEFRLVSSDEVLERGFARVHQAASHILVQSWLTDPPDRLPALLDRVATLPDLRRRVYLDSFANSDIRFARQLGTVDLYYKKSILKDARDMTRATEGHTTLMEFYGRLYGIHHETTDWQVPPDFLGRLRLAPNFLTGPGLLEAFLGPEPPGQDGRDIDLHARLGGSGEDSWYGAMRRDAEARVAAMPGLVTATGTGIPRPAFMAEMARARLCFSPFGYGELCWRDIEAFQAGAVLIKPDMAHLRTEPDLYRDGETYIATRWDFADLEEKVQALLADPDRRAYIAQTAWQACRDYLRRNGPVESYAEALA